MKAFILLILTLAIFVPGSAQSSLYEICESPSILLAEYDPLDRSSIIQCLSPTGNIATVFRFGGSGSLSPDRKYIAYTTTNDLGPSLFDYDVSLYIYRVDTGDIEQLRDHEGHISANWMSENDLLISTWDERITTYAAFKPNHRFLYNPAAEEMLELDWPVGNGARVVGFWSEQDSFLFANYSDGLIQISEGGATIPIPLPFDIHDTEFVLSPDNRFVAYRTNCDGEDVFGRCLTVFELGTDHSESITAFSEADQWVRFFRMSPTGRYIAVLLHPDNALGIYDLEQNEIVFELSTMEANGIAWARDEDRLFVSIADEDDQEDRLSFIYGLSPATGEMERLTSASRWWIGF